MRMDVGKHTFLQYRYTDKILCKVKLSSIYHIHRRRCLMAKGSAAPS